MRPECGGLGPVLGGGAGARGHRPSGELSGASLQTAAEPTARTWARALARPGLGRAEWSAEGSVLGGPGAEGGDACGMRAIQVDGPETVKRMG